jgi:hypothetical protein
VNYEGAFEATPCTAGKFSVSDRATVCDEVNFVISFVVSHRVVPFRSTRCERFSLCVPVPTELSPIVPAVSLARAFHRLLVLSSSSTPVARLTDFSCARAASAQWASSRPRTARARASAATQARTATFSCLFSSSFSACVVSCLVCRPRSMLAASSSLASLVLPRCRPRELKWMRLLARTTRVCVRFLSRGPL